jgi:hypothetical protein
LAKASKQCSQMFMHEKHLESMVKHRVWAPVASSDSVGLKDPVKLPFFHRVPGEAEAAG